MDDHSTIAASPRAEAFTLLAAAVFPCLAAWLYFVAVRDQPTALQQTVYAIGKIVQFGLPILWLFTRRRQVRWALPSAAGLLEGLLFGIAVLIAMLIGYHAWLQPAGYLAAAEPLIAEKIAGFGVDSPAKYFALGIFYCVIHSFLEEYYWRWFLFGGLRTLMPPVLAAAVSSLAFMGHHVIVLAAYFGAFSPATWFFSLSVAVGGAVWCWIYLRGQSLVGPWLSHVLVDAGIFLVGFDLLKKAAGW
jgi:uncharacterized protein